MKPTYPKIKPRLPDWTSTQWVIATIAFFAALGIVMTGLSIATGNGVFLAAWGISSLLAMLIGCFVAIGVLMVELWQEEKRDRERGWK